MADAEEKPNLSGNIGQMVRLLELKAKAAGVTREEYARGIVNGMYPPITEEELSEFPAASKCDRF